MSIEALRAFERTPADHKFHSSVQADFPEMRRRGWITLYPCSDGDYAEITAEGRSALAQHKEG